MQGVGGKLEPVPHDLQGIVPPSHTSLQVAKILDLR